MDFVNVAIRIKPSPLEFANVKSLKVISPSVIYVSERQQTFAFDNIFGEDSTQQNVYNELVKPLVEKVMHGYNSTIFAYGQTGTGKTYTIGSDPTYFGKIDAGLITRALNDVLLSVSDENKLVTIYISFVEIYNEKVYDLLSIDKAALQLKGFNVNGLSKHKVDTLIDAQFLLLQGGKNRHTGETRQNAKSSRSHAIFTIYCNVKDMEHETEAKLNLVDLAGSESVKKTGNEGSQFHEGININKGLLCIGQVINALSNNHSFVPYRQSTITTILQDSLNKKNYVTLIACVGTNLDDITETVQTLDFAQRAKKVRNRPELNNIIYEVNKANSLGPARSTPFTQRVLNFRTPFKPHSQNYSRRPQLLQTPSNLMASDRIASLSSVPDTSISFSPIIKRCIKEAENAMMQQLTSIMTVQRRSPRFLQRSPVRANISIDPEFHTFRNEINRKGDTSELPMDSPRTSPITSGNKTPVFKRPQVPLKRGRGRPPRAKIVAALSPIDDESLKIDIDESSVTSVRMQARRSMRVRSTSEFRYSPPENVAIRHRHRHSIRVVKDGKHARKNKAKQDVNNCHSKSVLSILNFGNVEELCSLSSIGRKTAAMICQFRKIKGKFNKISDLKGMPWRGDGYKRFLSANFVELS